MTVAAFCKKKKKKAEIRRYTLGEHKRHKTSFMCGQIDGLAASLWSEENVLYFFGGIKIYCFYFHTFDVWNKITFLIHFKIYIWTLLKYMNIYILHYGNKNNVIQIKSNQITFIQMYFTFVTVYTHLCEQLQVADCNNNKPCVTVTHVPYTLLIRQTTTTQYIRLFWHLLFPLPVHFNCSQLA